MSGPLFERQAILSWMFSCRSVPSAPVIFENTVDHEDGPPLPQDFIYLEKYALTAF